MRRKAVDGELLFSESGRLKLCRHNQQIIYQKMNGHCSYCGRELDPFEAWHIEHMIPKNQDGPTVYENLVPSCQKCNGWKSNRAPEQFRAAIIDRLHREIDELQNLFDQLNDLAPDYGNYIQKLRECVDDKLFVFYFERMLNSSEEEQ
jgi:hypothetical protein